MSVTVSNVSGTKDDRAIDVCGCPSWIEHWRRVTGSGRKTCMTIGCSNPVAVGAHIRAYRGKTIHIVGLCRSCNHPSREDFFEVDERTWWAPAEYTVGCGVLRQLVPGNVVLRSPTASERLTLIEFVEFEAEDVAQWKVFTSSGRSMTVRLHGEKVRLA